MDYINHSFNKSSSKSGFLLSARLKIFIAIVLGMVFVCSFFLYLRLDNVNVGNENERSEGKAIAKSAIETKKFIKPELVHNGFIYPRLLKQKSIHDNLPTYNVPEEVEHRLRCGAFKNKPRALQLMNQLTEVLPMNINTSGKWFIVNSDWFENKRAAQRIGNRIKKITRIYSCILQIRK